MVSQQHWYYPYYGMPFLHRVVFVADYTQSRQLHKMPTANTDLFCEMIKANHCAHSLLTY